MEVKAGYKKTDVGIIPEDWKIKPLSELTKDIGDGIHATPEYVSTSDYYFINGNNLLNGEIIITENTMCVSDKEYRRLRKQLDGSTVLMSINGTIGNLAYYKDEKVVLGKSAAYINVNQEIRKEFLYYMLQSHETKLFYENELTGTTIRNLSLGSIRNTPIPLPPTKTEQEAIAEALSDADALIEALEQLIAQKRQVKQGAMQELLTGKRRLPGFAKKTGYKQTEVGKIPEDWDVKFLPDVCKFRGGKAHEQYISDLGQFICVNSKFISTEGEVRKYSTKNFCSAKKGDVLMVMSDLPNGKALAKAFWADEDDLYAVNQRVCALTSYQDNSKYLFYVLNRNPYFLKFDNGVSQTHLLNPVFQKCPLAIPSIKAEQTAIAEILSDMDAEIAALEGKLSKARQVKQGMMSVLLTGRIQLI